MRNKKPQPFYKIKQSCAALKYLFYIACTKLGCRKVDLASAKMADIIYLFLGGREQSVIPYTAQVFPPRQ